MSEQQEIIPAATLELTTDDPLASWLDPTRVKQIEFAAQKLARSNLVPDAFKGKPDDCFIAVQMAARLGVDPFPLMQNMFVLYGKPCLSAQMKLALVEANNVFASKIKYKTGADDVNGSWCIAYAKTHDGDTVEGPMVSMKIAKDDGWYDRKDRQGNYTSKWRTIPGLMLMYRAADWLVRLYGGNALFGLPSADEVFDAGEKEIEGERIDIEAPEGLRGEILMPEDVKSDKTTAPTRTQPAKPGPRLTVKLHNGESIALPADIAVQAQELSAEHKKLFRQLMASAPDQIADAVKNVKESVDADRHDVFERAGAYLIGTLATMEQQESKA